MARLLKSLKKRTTFPTGPSSVRPYIRAEPPLRPSARRTPLTPTHTPPHPVYFSAWPGLEGVGGGWGTGHVGVNSKFDRQMS